VAISPGGDALIVWTYSDGTPPDATGHGYYGCCPGLRAMVVDAEGRRGPVTTLGPKGAPYELRGLDIASARRFAVAFGSPTGTGATTVRQADGTRRFGEPVQAEGTSRMLAVDADPSSCT
jgi:hypothetical protein